MIKKEFYLKNRIKIFKSCSEVKKFKKQIKLNSRGDILFNLIEEHLKPLISNLFEKLNKNKIILSNIEQLNINLINLEKDNEHNSLEINLYYYDYETKKEFENRIKKENEEIEYYLNKISNEIFNIKFKNTNDLETIYEKVQSSIKETYLKLKEEKYKNGN